MRARLWANMVDTKVNVTTNVVCSLSCGRTTHTHTHRSILESYHMIMRERDIVWGKCILFFFIHTNFWASTYSCVYIYINNVSVLNEAYMYKCVSLKVKSSLSYNTNILLYLLWTYLWWSSRTTTPTACAAYMKICARTLAAIKYI